MTGLKLEEDAFGQMIWAYHNGKEVYEVVERDDGYVDVTRPEQYFSSYDEWSQIEQEAMEFVKGKVLDVGCGAGRHSLYLQRKGFEVLGIDISPLAIKVCKSRGLKKAEIMSIEDVNFRPKSFEAITMMGNNFGLFANFKKARYLLRKFHKITSDEGVIIADTRDPYQTENPAHLEYHKANKRKGRMGGQVRIRIRFRKYVGRWFDYLMVSKEEMKEILGGTSWKVEEFLDSEGSEYIAILRKVV